MIAILVATAHARTYRVEVDGSGDFKTLGEAVVGAAAGDELLLGVGTFSDQVFVDKDLTLRGAGRDTRLGGSGGGGYVLTIDKAIVVLADLVVEPRSGGGIQVQSGAELWGERLSVVNAWSSLEGGGLRLLEDSSAELVDSVFVGNGSDFEGGAIFADGGRLALVRTDFLDNTSRTLGGAVSVESASLVSEGGIWSKNSGTAVYVGSTSTASFLRDQFFENEAAADQPTDVYVKATSAGLTLTQHRDTGYPLLLSADTVDLVDLFAEGESAVSGARCTVRGSSFVDNVLSNGSSLGALQSTCESLEVSGSFVCGAEGKGGVVIAGGAVTVSDTLLTGNASSGLAVSAGSVILQRTMFQDNLSVGLTFAGGVVGEGTGNNFFGGLQTTTVDDPGRGYAAFGDTTLDPGFAGFTTCKDVAVVSTTVAAGIQSGPTDDDGDGACEGFFCETFPAETLDCDDADPSRSPSSEERPADGVDSDCDGWELCYVDSDRDGFGSAVTTKGDRLCSLPGMSLRSDDCNDGNGAQFPGATEQVGDSVDQDCDTQELCFVDLDDDGARTGSVVASGDADCTDATEGLATDPLDCNDGSSAIKPGAAELPADNVDQNCDGVENCYTDGDNDDFGTTLVDVGGSNNDADCNDANEAVVTTDCNDGSFGIRPGVSEQAGDNVDQNCDLVEDCFTDGDSDTFRGTGVDLGGANNDADCTDLGEWELADVPDCNDANVAVNPGALELAGDGADQNCDGIEACFGDVDGDGARNTSATAGTDVDCSDVGELLANVVVDCDDGNSLILPGVSEQAGDNVDQNCDGVEDCFTDADADTFRGTGIDPGGANDDADCDDGPEALATALEDCDDSLAAVNPAATELPADGTDSDCDTRELCHVDGDQDGAGTSALVNVADLTCVGPDYVASATPADCDDSTALRSPFLAEVPGDDLDQDCDGVEDCFRDADGDGARSALATPGVAGEDDRCDDPGEVGASALVDCDDSDPLVGPGTPEIPGDGVDSDCDLTELCFVDGDGDGARSGVFMPSAVLDCDVTGFLSDTASLDCDDSNALVSPTAVETPGDDVDGDCDGIELCYVDVDGDGAAGADVLPTTDTTCDEAGLAVAGAPADCDDDDGARSPTFTEVAGDEVDGDCDGGEICFTDEDGDGATTGVERDSADEDCGDADELPLGGAFDCDDAAPGVYSGATEVVGDGVDQSCDGQEACLVDEDDDDSPIDVVVGSLDLDCDDFGEAAPGALDCNDQDGTQFPGAPEGPGDEFDSNCDGEELCFADGDGDGARALVTVVSLDLACDAAGEAVSGSPIDCDDLVSTRFPGAFEVVGNEADEDCDGSEVCYVDADRDGAPSTSTAPSADVDCQDDGEARAGGPVDCDDGQPLVFPGGIEVCDALDLDEDCNGVADDGDPAALGTEVWYLDTDGDGYGDGPGSIACNTPREGVLFDGDCDNADVLRFPGAPEPDCTDPVDYNCDGFAGSADNDGDGALACEDCDDDDDTVSALADWWADEDGDAFGTGSPVGLVCVPQPGQALVDGDCDELDADRFPGAPERCNGVIDDCDAPALPAAEADLDADRYTVCVPGSWLGLRPPIGGGDCDDEDPDLKPGAFDELVGDGVDQNCDGLESCLVDLDGDGAAGTLVDVAIDVPCAAPTDFDCDDANAAIGPSAEELPFDRVDQDCDGEDACWADFDADGIGGVLVLVPCSDPVAAQTDDDCDDANADVSPNRDEVCNDVDDDCNGVVDDGFPTLTVYTDADGDGYGSDDLGPRQTCLRPEGVSVVSGDCDDADAEQYPGALDECGGADADRNCDGVGLPCTGADLDGDGYCDGRECAAGLLPNDCDDVDPTVHPGSAEQCDGFDQDCNGLVDDGLDVDLDLDGFPVASCLVGARVDCDDGNEAVNPAAFESCNQEDDDCDGDVDEGLDVDVDGDNWYPSYSCNLPGGRADCDDADPFVRPFAADPTIDGVDQNCDGEDGPPSLDRDADGDGFCGGGGFDEDGDGRCDGPTDDPAALPDCDDTLLQNYPGAPELPDGVDNDCDGVVDNGVALGPDNDGDGVHVPDDCDDTNAAVNPTAPEACNGVDDDCDGVFGDLEFDVDRDGWLACGGDCDDEDAAVNPNRAEDCQTGIDENCSGATDDTVDHDLDGFTACNGDCWDVPNPPAGSPAGADVFPALEELLCDGFDSNCDGQVDNGFDNDRDGVTACPECSGPDCDCDDFDSGVRPGIPETCGNNVDENCDGLLVNANADGDAFGVCEGDCDDADPYVSPTAPEVCNGVDDDCNGLQDEVFDEDGDGVLTCYGDCDDTTDEIRPGLDELCNGGVDDDCDAETDEVADGVCPPECEPEPEVCDDGVDNDCDDDVDGDDADCLEPELHTGDTSDTGEPPPVKPPDGDEGCACDQTAPLPLGVGTLALVALLALRRRQEAA